MIILGIETSCDETAASVVKYDKNGVVVLSNIISSQIEIHKKYNGVVPEIAAREHVLNILPVINEAIAVAGINTPRRSSDTPPCPAQAVIDRGDYNIDAIAVTAGPGLITSLLVGVESAKTLAFVWKKPLVAVNHIEGHIAANFITSPNPLSAKRDKEGKLKTPSPYQGEGWDEVKNIKFPSIILTVSGGHTMLVLAKKIGDYKIIGDTRDDAAGEAFDKAAKLMELGYPGGPIVSKWAEEFITSPNPLLGKERELKTPSPLQGEGWDEVKNKIEKINLPRPMIDSPDFDFSFSGLKTALLYKLKKDDKWRERIPEYCFEFQNAVVETLIKKTIKAARKYQAKTIMLAGGVSANKCLREKFIEAATKENLESRIPEFKYTTDNAAMIAAAGCFLARAKKFTPWKKIKADCNLSF